MEHCCAAVSMENQTALHASGLFEFFSYLKNYPFDRYADQNLSDIYAHKFVQGPNLL
jgi:hypothetical protein